MKTTIANERILVFQPELSLDEAKNIAWQKKIDAFGAVNKVASFLSKPKDDDFELVYSESRLQPFWHVMGEAHYVYDRNNEYHWSVSGEEVQSVTIDGKKYPVSGGKVSFKATDHCEQETHEEVFMDGLTGQRSERLREYLTFATQEVSKEDLEKLSKTDQIIIPPEARVSVVVREVMAHSVKVIQADEIFEESINLSRVDLYYLPVYAFQFRWVSKNKEAIIEIDGLTGKVSTGSQMFKKYLGKALDRDFLFDLGADAAGMFIPGGSIAVKVAKKVMDRKKK